MRTTHKDHKPLEDYREAVEAEPGSAKAHLLLGTALLHRRKLDEAEKEFRHAIEIDSNCAGAWVNLGGILLGRWDFNGCVEANMKAAECEPELMQAHYNRGLGHMYLKEPQAMVECFERVIEIDPEHAGAHYHLAVGLLAQGKQRQARERLDVAVKLGYSPQPDFVRALSKTEGVTTFELGPSSPQEPEQSPDQQQED